jgi:hypothetical protein
VSVIRTLLMVALLALPTTAGAFTIEWFPLTTATGYDVERSVDTAAWTAVGKDVPCAGAMCSWTDPAPITAGCARSRVVSKNAGGAQASATFAGECLPEEKPIVTPALPPPPAVDAVEVRR